jgi:UDP-glucuronate decarboxylase
MSGIFGNVLVLGGGGFIGSHLVRAILARSPATRVTVLDNFCTGQKQNISKLQGQDRFRLVEHDATDLSWLREFLENSGQFSLILHFASPASPPRYQELPVQTYQVNTFTTHVLAEYCANTGARMVFASTSEIYGDPLVHPQPESYWGNVNPNGIRSCYDEAKRFAETICGVHVRDFQADIRLVRIFNTYGPNMDPYDGRVIPDFCMRVLRQEPLRVFGSGEQTRSFCYVEDLVAGILSLAETEGLAGETVNLGNSDEFTMLELSKELEKVVGHELEIEFLPLPSDDPKRRKPDITKAQTLLKWKPTISLAQGLVPTYQYFQNWFRENES